MPNQFQIVKIMFYNLRNANLGHLSETFYCMVECKLDYICISIREKRQNDEVEG